MIEYVYDNVSEPPHLTAIEAAIKTSAMANTNVLYCRWDSDTSRLRVYFDETLSAEDEDILDSLVGTRDFIVALPSATRQINFPLGGESQPYFSVNSTTWTVAAMLVFCGTPTEGVPWKAQFVAEVPSGREMEVRFFDQTRGIELAKVSEIASTSPQMHETTDIGEFAGTPVVLEIQVRRTSQQGGQVKLYYAGLCV